MICCCAGHKHGLGREGFRPKGSAKEPPALGPNRPVARGTGSIKASAAPGRQRQHVPARPDVCLRGESERSNHSHTAGQPFLLPAPNPVRSRLPLDRPPPESTRGRWACSCCGRRHARKRTSIRVLISRPSPPVPKNSIPPFLLSLSFDRSRVGASFGEFSLPRLVAQQQIRWEVAGLASSRRLQLSRVL